MDEARMQVVVFFSIIADLKDFRHVKGRLFDLDLLLFCLLLTELKNCRRQRQRVRWLSGNWDWIREIWKTKANKDSSQTAPSQSTLSRLLKGIDLWALTEQYHAARRAAFHKDRSDTTDAETPAISLRHYAIDGKARAGIVSPVTGRTEIDVTVFDVRTREVLALRNLSDKQGESTAVQNILKHKGRTFPLGIFSSDAGITSPKVTARMISAGHQYLLALKENAGEVYSICRAFKWGKVAIINETSDDAHGRKEKRYLRRISLSRSRSQQFSKYSKCGYLYQVESIRMENSKETREVRYFIGSRGLKGLLGKEILTIIREHWIIENGLHWVKDAVLAEDNLHVMSNRSSRVLGFLKNMVVTIGFSIYRSVQRFVDEFDASPKKFTKHLLQLE